MSNRGKRALIAGATGYIGSKLTCRLIQEGWTVDVIAMAGDPCLSLQGIRDRIVVHEYNGATESLIRIMKSAAPDVVFHLASCFLAEHTSADIERLIASNVLFGTQLLESMAVAGVTRLVNTGTSWQHYQDQDYNPVCLYAATKQALEAVIRFYTEARGVRCITLKLLDTYGPDDPRPKLFSFLKRAALSQEVIAMSPGEQQLDLVYIDDVVAAFVCAAKLTGTLPEGETKTYAVRTGRACSLKELVRLYERASGKTLPINFGGRVYRDREVMTPWMREKTPPGWKAEVLLEEGIGRMLDSAGK
jgi:nucleoside-diphosphate-sugar epimerase